jgi:hypothetical protein
MRIIFYLFVFLIISCNNDKIKEDKIKENYYISKIDDMSINTISKLDTINITNCNLLQDNIPLDSIFSFGDNFQFQFKMVNSRSEIINIKGLVDGDFLLIDLSFNDSSKFNKDFLIHEFKGETYYLQYSTSSSYNKIYINGLTKLKYQSLEVEYIIDYIGVDPYFDFEDTRSIAICRIPIYKNGSIEKFQILDINTIGSQNCVFLFETDIKQLNKFLKNKNVIDEIYYDSIKLKPDIYLNYANKNPFVW